MLLQERILSFHGSQCRGFATNTFRWPQFNAQVCLQILPGKVHFNCETLLLINDIPSQLSSGSFENRRKTRTMPDDSCKQTRKIQLLLLSPTHDFAASSHDKINDKARKFHSKMCTSITTFTLSQLFATCIEVPAKIINFQNLPQKPCVQMTQIFPVGTAWFFAHRCQHIHRISRRA